MQPPVPRVAAIHDLSDSDASLTVVMPIHNDNGHTGLSDANRRFFDAWVVSRYQNDRLTDVLREYLDHWRSIGMTFGAIYSGFLNSFARLMLWLVHFGFFLPRINLSLLIPCSVTMVSYMALPT